MFLAYIYDGWGLGDMAAVFLGGSALLTWLFVWGLLRLAPRIGLVDRPNERSSHTRVTPRGGGIGFVSSVFLMALSILVVSALTIGGPFGAGWFAYLGAAGFIAVISLWDDFRSLGAGIRFFCHFAAAGIVIWQMGAFSVIDIPGGGGINLMANSSWLAVFSWGLTALWLVGLTNVYNFMDGIDGIAGLQGLIAGLTWAVAGWWIASPPVLLLGLLLAGGCAGFLVYNWSPAKIFMGDVGSAFLGFSFAVLPLFALASPHSGDALDGRLPLFAAFVTWPFIGDGLFTFLWRLFNGERVWVAHRGHLYQRLVIYGWSHSRVSTLYGLWAVLSSALGLGYLGGGSIVRLIAVCFAGGSLCILLIFVARVSTK